MASDLPYQTGLVGHWAARLLTGLSDGDAIVSFTDQSVNADHLTSPSAGERPIYREVSFRGLPAADFDDASNRWTRNEAMSYSEPFVLHLVCNNPENVGSWSLLAGATDPLPAPSDYADLLFGIDAANNGTQPGFYLEGGLAAGGGGAKTVEAPLEANFHVYTWIYDGESMRFRIDGTEQTILADFDVIPSAGAYTRFFLGDGSGSGAFQGQISEAALVEGTEFGNNEAFLMDMYASPAPVRVTSKILGCGEYRVVLGLTGGTFKTELPWIDLDFNYVLDDMGTGRVTIDAAKCNPYHVELFSTKDPWELEVSFYRDNELAFVGLPLEPEFDDNLITLGLRDLFQWFERRRLPYDRSMTNDLTRIFVQYAEDALDRDTSPNITIQDVASGVVGTREVLAASFVRAADELRELARDGVDFTMRGRTLRVGGEELTSTEPVLFLLREMVENPVIKPRADETATEWIVKGGGQTAVYGRAIAAGTSLPLIEQVSQEFSILDDSSAIHAAQSRIDMVQVTPVRFSANLRQSAQIRFSELIPGIRVHPMMQVGAREIDQELRLRYVGVSATGGESGNTENVSVELIPIGATD